MYIFEPMPKAPKAPPPPCERPYDFAGCAAFDVDKPEPRGVHPQDHAFDGVVADQLSYMKG